MTKVRKRKRKMMKMMKKKEEKIKKRTPMGRTRKQQGEVTGDTG